MNANWKYPFAKVVVAFVMLLFIGCSDTDDTSALVVDEPEMALSNDLDSILARGKLTILTENSATSYFIYKGETMGFEFELLQDFADHLGVDLEVQLVSNLDTMFEALENGSCDIVAANLTVTKDRAQQVKFSEPLYMTRQVLVQRKPDNWRKLSSKERKAALIDDQVELGGASVYVRKNSSFYTRLQSLSNEIGQPINIVDVPGDLETEELIKMVSDGEIPYTIADENVAKLNQARYENLDCSLPISFDQQIAWATHKKASALQSALDTWLIASKEDGHVQYMYKKYHHFSSSEKHVESDFSSLAGGKISSYDYFLQDNSPTIPWDWRLLAALIYEESKFDNNKQSWAGAFGMMQLMPRTAGRYGIDSTASPEENMYAGIDKLKRLNKHWQPILSDSTERIKFILASYNAGLGHVQDAVRLAEKLGKDPLVWDENVADCMLLKAKKNYYNDEVVKYGYCRGTEPFNYVKEVIARYEAYKAIIPNAKNV